MLPITTAPSLRRCLSVVFYLSFRSSGCPLRALRTARGGSRSFPRFASSAPASSCASAGLSSPPLAPAVLMAFFFLNTKSSASRSPSAPEFLRPPSSGPGCPARSLSLSSRFTSPLCSFFRLWRFCLCPCPCPDARLRKYFDFGDSSHLRLLPCSYLPLFLCLLAPNCSVWVWLLAPFARAVKLVYITLVVPVGALLVVVFFLAPAARQLPNADFRWFWCCLWENDPRRWRAWTRRPSS